jgi:hypothetical protein
LAGVITRQITVIQAAASTMRPFFDNVASPASESTAGMSSLAGTLVLPNVANAMAAPDRITMALKFTPIIPEKRVG